LGPEKPFDTDTVSALGKLGWDISKKQRLQFTVNFLNQRQDTEFVTDPNSGSRGRGIKARAKKREGLEFPKRPGRDNLVLNLNYSHEDLLNSDVDAQLFYRNFENVSGAVPIFGDILQTTSENEQWGTRLDVETPLAENGNLDLTWGLDYINETNQQTSAILEETGNQFRAADQKIFTPFYRFDTNYEWGCIKIGVASGR